MGGNSQHLTGLGAGEPFAEIGFELPHRHLNCYYSCHRYCSYCDHARPIVEHDQEVVIARSGVPGAMRGQIALADDFDAPLDGLFEALQ